MVIKDNLKIKEIKRLDRFILVTTRICGLHGENRMMVTNCKQRCCS